MLSHNLFDIVFVHPTLNLLVAFYKLFLLAKIPGAFGFAILALTIFVRLILHPFFKKQIHTTKKMQDLKPHLDNLSKQHKKDPKKLQQEQMRLYQEAGINPMAGCLFAVVQIPVFIGLYNTLRLFLTNGTTGHIISQINSVLYSPVLKINSIDPHFFIFNLALTPAKAHIWYYYLIPVVTAILQYLQTKVTMAQTMPAPKIEDKTDGKEKKESSTSEDFQKAMNMQMKYFIPFMIGTASYNFPVGLSLYWNIFSLFSIIQQKHITKNSNSKSEIRNSK